MTKRKLEDLTKDDWNALFPIQLVDHNPQWKDIFEIEKQLILSKVGEDSILRIAHFGSSSIPKIKSKPYIDMLIEIPKSLLFDIGLIQKMEALGYSYFVVPKRNNFDAYMSFGKGYHTDGTKAQIFHIHMCPDNSDMWQQLKFRDYLNANDEHAKNYENLKLELASKFKNDRGAYVLGKTEFIMETLDLINSN